MAALTNDVGGMIKSFHADLTAEMGTILREVAAIHGEMDSLSGRMGRVVKRIDGIIAKVDSFRVSDAPQKAPFVKPTQKAPKAPIPPDTVAFAKPGSPSDDGGDINLEDLLVKPASGAVNAPAAKPGDTAALRKTAPAGGGEIDLEDL